MSFCASGHVLCVAGRPARYRPVDADGSCLDVHVFSRRRLFAPLSVLGVLGIATGAYLYATEPHVSSRVDRFITPSSGDTYQVDKAMDAIKSGGIVGSGRATGASNQFCLTRIPIMCLRLPPKRAVC